ncbi:MAG: type II toxin-antitoxin system VapC family toxin [Anaerolineales bacterium]|nr:type II toxin-antitoxin system VapC family toxin [Anaerolineales bacterium]
MKLAQFLASVKKLFLDTAPLIYYVEEDARYLSRVEPIFDQLDAGSLTAVTSPVTLAECLVMPIRKNQAELERAFTDLVIGGDNVAFKMMDDTTAKKAADLRARYNLALPDAFQAAVAIHAGCDAFLTNDVMFKRVAELNVIVVEEIEIEQASASKQADGAD